MFLLFLLQGVSISVSVLTLSVISVERWYAICHPLKFKSTTTRARVMIFLIWVVALGKSAAIFAWVISFKVLKGFTKLPNIVLCSFKTFFCILLSSASCSWYFCHSSPSAHIFVAIFLHLQPCCLLLLSVRPLSSSFTCTGLYVVVCLRFFIFSESIRILMWILPRT